MLCQCAAPFHAIDRLVRRKRAGTENRSGSEGCGKFRLLERDISRDRDLTAVGWDGGRRDNRKRNERSRRGGTQAPMGQLSPEKCYKNVIK